MISLSNISIVDTLKKFQYARNGGGLDVAFLVPTKTGYAKSIMDATKEVRNFLLEKGIHNFDTQLQGQEHKVSIRATVFSKDVIKETSISLYRPETKSGDSRIWILDLKELADPTDLLAIGQSNDGLFVINCSKSNLDILLNIDNSIFWNLSSSENNTLFPAEFINWSGAKRGGVRKPFMLNSGRPTGQRIKTPLTIKLESWVTKLVDTIPSETPRVIILIGGPGNGKTDAVEGCINDLDIALKADGKLNSCFKDKYDVDDGGLPPRKVIVDFSDLWKGSSTTNPEIHLVQDATEKDPSQSNISPESLFNDDLNAIINKEYKGIYICCVNRGVLANATSLAYKQENEPLLLLLNELVNAATCGPESIDCWPLSNFNNIAVWPMDVESLVRPSRKSAITVMHKILKVALDDASWNDPCKNSNSCPFCQNKVLLSDINAQNNLIDLLHYYELSSGKKWTFRDLYSLLSYIFIGDQDELMIYKKLYDPCEWTAKQLDLIRQNKDNVKTAKAPYLVMSKFYHHRLFSLWPTFTTGKHRKAKHKALLKEPKVRGFDAVYMTTKNHFRALANLSSPEVNSIKKILNEGFSQQLDPALMTGDILVFESVVENNKIDVTARYIDERFGMSINDGLKLVSRRITKVEKMVLKELAQSDEFLMGYNHSVLIAHHVKLLQVSLRQYAARLVKRSLGVKYGLCRDIESYKAYARFYEDSKQSRNIEKQVRNLINTSGCFSIPLSTTFGQPVAHRDRNISLLASEVKPKIVKPHQMDGRPEEYLPYIRILKDSNPFPITFDLFKSLSEIEKGLNEASLPEEIFAMLDEIKSVVAGKVVRNEDYLDSTAKIQIGSEEYEIDLEEGLAFLEGAE